MFSYATNGRNSFRQSRIRQSIGNLSSGGNSNSTSNNISKNSTITVSSTLNKAPLETVNEPGSGHSGIDCLPQPVFHSVEHRGSRNNRTTSGHNRAQKQYITPEHHEMIKYVQQSWKGVERDYKKSVNNYINTIDLKQTSTVKNKTATSSTPLLMPGSYHHTSDNKDSFQPFDLETFWGNRILKSLTEDFISKTT